MKQQLPDFFVKKLEQQYGNELCEKIKESFEKSRFTTFRVNTLKSNNEEIEKALKDNSIEFEKASISDNAYIVKNANEAKIQELEAFKEGKIYLQSLSSMLPPIILEPKENSDILDMAAAPGGKTTQMAAISNNKSHITACERNAIRAEKLKYNIEKQGASCVFCMVKDSREIDDFFSFDQILLDAPCSGSGTLDLQNEKLNKYFTETLIEKSVKTQKQLLNKAIKILKKGSEMVYSTCSILQEENEEVIQSILKTGKVEIVPIEIEKLGNLPVLPTSIKGTLCLMPNEYFEGFFVAKLKKKE
ncbi:MAG: RsmB/NOP family class I SAM-dependent RNA methyltransferase [Clostridia bacterium]|nr:RsmB/NOP family class I SAM-dependent RNA methyltransferase [Clostridia bacterium]